MRRRSASRALGTVLWLAYLSADTVAIFVLGHLAVHVRGPSHELMLFWAPFVLIHLGGQDTITAFSKQDNELWMRHLLNLVSQVAVAGYVVSRSSWPDAKLRAAMVLMFIHGFLKYTGRIICLYSASPKSLGSSSLGALSEKIQTMQLLAQDQTSVHPGGQWFVEMFVPDVGWEYMRRNPPSLQADDIMSVDAPVNDVGMIAIADDLPDILEEYQSSPHRCFAYQYVATILVQSYKYLYTKAPLLDHVVQFFDCTTTVDGGELFYVLSILAHAVFNLSTTVVALALFASAEKESHRHSRADIIVSYLLLLGALVLDLLPAFTSIVVTYVRKTFGLRRPTSCIAEWPFFCTSLISCIIPKGWQTTKQWSEEIAQYNMIKRYTSVQGYCSCMPASLRTCIGERFESFDLTRTPVTNDLKLLVLDKLLLQSRRKEWDCSFRGERALGKWMDRRLHVVPAPERSSGYDALHESISSRVDFPTSVLIWHIATDICYFSEDKGCESSEETRKKKTTASRELSLYIMYLVFKCDVMLTSISRLAHKRAHEGLTEFLISDHQQSPQVNYLEEKEAVKEVFKAMKKEAEQQKDKKNQEQHANKDEDDATTATSHRMQEILQSTEEALNIPVLPRARAVAQELMEIVDEADRWDLISEVWLEMLFYTAPRCGAAFHYEHLSTGGEFISHVLLLMRRLGPFLPKPGA